MNIADVDRMAGYSEGFGPLAQALQWLDTLTRSPTVEWSAGQREAAQRVLKDARRVLYSDLLQMARDTLDGKTPPAASDAAPANPNTAFQMVTQDGGATVDAARDYNAAYDLTRAINQRRGAA